MLLRRHPYVPIAPPAQLTQLLHLRMLVLHVILDRQARRVVDAHVAAQPEQDAGLLVREQARVRALPQAAVQHQDLEPAIPAAAVACEVRLGELQCRAELESGDPVGARDLVRQQERPVALADRRVVVARGDREGAAGIGGIRREGLSCGAEGFGVVEVTVDRRRGRRHQENVNFGCYRRCNYRSCDMQAGSGTCGMRDDG